MKPKIAMRARIQVVMMIETRVSQALSTILVSLGNTTTMGRRFFTKQRIMAMSSWQDHC
jgi:hypothetical protein